MRDCSGDLVRFAETLKNGMLSSLSSKSYIGVVAHPMLAAMIHAETLNEPIASPEDAQLSFLLAQVLSGPHDERGDQNGLEAWRLLVRSEQPVSGANRIGRCNLSCSSSYHQVLTSWKKS